MKYTIKNEQGHPCIYAGDRYVACISLSTPAEQAAILAGLNGPGEAKDKRVAELRQLAADYRDLQARAMGTNRDYCRLTARDFDSQADYLEKTP